MSPLPDFYPSPVELPFNHAALRGRLERAAPDADPGGSGVWLLLRGSELLVTGAAPYTLPSGTAPPLAGTAPPLYLGRWDEVPCRALPVSRQSELPSGLTAENLSAPEPGLDIDLLSLGGLATQLLHWERHSAFCPRCGGATLRLAGEWGKRCAACAYDYYPSLHPCVIVVVRRPGEVLLARKAGWPAGRYGLVAGFVDSGEALEEAVVREVREETGVEVGDIRYVGSQCWPFPSQLMVGFTAEYRGGELKVDTHELEDARWFRLDALPDLPPRRSIARYLLDHHRL